MGNGAWGVVLGSFIAHFFSLGTMYSFGVLLDPLIEEFGVGTALVALVGSLGTGIFSFAAAVVAPLIPKYGVRKVIAGGTLIAVAAILASSVSNSIWLVLLFYGVILGFPLVGVLYKMTTPDKKPTFYAVSSATSSVVASQVAARPCRTT